MSAVSGSSQMLADLVTGSHLMSLEELPRKVARCASCAGLQDVLIYLVDLEQDVLSRVGRGPDGGGAGGTEATLPVEGSAAGEVFQRGQLMAAPSPGAHGARRWWVPLLDGTERLGVLLVTVEADSEQVKKDMWLLAGLVALIVVSKRGMSDSHARLVRTRSMNVAAEMQWHLMPPLTFATERIAICAVLEPAYEISGDAFDYAIDDDVLHLEIFDAMGHDTAAGLTANLAVAACRNSRRRRAGLVGASEAIERTLIEQFGTCRYTTGILADLNLNSGDLSWINRGHHPPVIIRGRRHVTVLDCPPTPPMGTDVGLDVSLCRDRLEPGDLLLLHTDGITEARGPDGQEFGLDRFLNFVVRSLDHGMPMPETLRRLMRDVLAYHHGRLRDDATVTLVQWHGRTPFDPREIQTLVGLPETPG
ncbi:PP2C family protein-serine/threonine phosphatase [Streptomyces sp. NPDC005322]|uniref:PP2C family protein-serine/threonine phosphatase n=1 Tax=Streptomyces sp. NPDC005322 TaxID=3157032 RepID=UPI0033AD42D3